MDRGEMKHSWQQSKTILVQKNAKDALLSHYLGRLNTFISSENAVCKA